MDAYKRRQAMKNLAQGRGTQEDITALQRESYGQAEKLPIEADGVRVRVGDRNYFIPNGADWISGKGITIEQAYRITEETDQEIEVRRVNTPSELESIGQQMLKDIREKLRNRLAQ